MELYLLSIGKALINCQLGIPERRKDQLYERTYLRGKQVGKIHLLDVPHSFNSVLNVDLVGFFFPRKFLSVRYFFLVLALRMTIFGFDLICQTMSVCNPSEPFYLCFLFSVLKILSMKWDNRS